MHLKHNRLLVSLALTLFCTVLAHAQSIVRLNAESIAAHDTLTLADVAVIKANDLALRERLQSIQLGFAPNIGAVRELTRERISASLAASGLTNERVKLEGANIVRVRRASQRVEANLLRATIERAIAAQLGKRITRLKLKRLDAPANLEFPLGEVEMKATLGAIRSLSAPFTIFLELQVDNRVARRLSLTAEVEAYAAIAVAARDLPANGRFRNEDARIEERHLAAASEIYVQDLALLRGTSLHKSLAAGEAITVDLLQRDIVIRHGDAVRIEGVTTNFTVAVAGEARGAGRIGERISVKNVASGAMLQATIVDEGVVSVRF